jgi:Glycosyl hydrolases family 2, TIM barrel domain/Glycosyl hydrolases family 2/Glycosyl hydrolases family 2, sugar binding domain
MHRRRFLQLAGRLGAFLGMATPRLHPLAQRKKTVEGPNTLTFTLDSGWLIATDPNNAGRDQSWFRAPQPGAKATRVPSVLQETFPAYHGVVWYWLKFKPEPQPFENGRYLLRFNSVDYSADVWLNSVHLGSHEGSETPFVLDATNLIRPGTDNTLSLRVLNPDNQPIDGIVLPETPHRNKVVNFSPGNSFDYGGILLPVELLLTPSIRIASLHLRPDWETGIVRIDCELNNETKRTHTAHIDFSITRTTMDEPMLAQTRSFTVAAGNSTVHHEMQLANHRLWQLDDPCLYRLQARLEPEEGEEVHEVSSCFGFRDFRVVDGYFRLNGRRIFLKSTHTGNHVPFGQVVPTPGYPDLLRRDLLYAKASGFNMVRYISGLAYPDELNMCDELGLLVYEETLAAWLLADSPKMKERYESCIREMILRDRNHPSVAIWGMLNETKDGPVFREAVSALPLVRSLDETRLVLLSSGRFDGHLEIGSVSNPGSSEWEPTWGEEALGAPLVEMKYPSGVGTGDFHLYPKVPQTPEVNRMMRTLGENSKPVFLSEYGIGSMMDVIHEARKYEQAAIPEDAEDFVLMRSMADRLTADWSRFAMESAYPYPETLLEMSQRSMAHHRLLGFNLIRSNPKLCGFNLTGMLDHAMTGEGLWRFWRDWKPGVFDAVCDGWAPVRWCLFAEPGHTYLGRPVALEAVLANEDTLHPGTYPAHFQVVGPNGSVWQRESSVSIPDREAPLAVQVLKEDVVLQGPAGTYELIPFIQRAAPPESRWKFYLSDLQSLPKINQQVTTWHMPENVESWLSAHGVRSTPLSGAPRETRELILVGDVSKRPAGAGEWQQLAARMATGSTVVFLSPLAFERDKKASAWLPLANKGRIYQFNDWLYHKECVAKPHPVFAGLQGSGILDWTYYGPVLPHYLLDGQDTPAEVIAAAFAAGYSTPGGYASGVLLGSYRFGAGQFFVNTFPLLENNGTHPAADRLLLNLLQYAAASVQGPAVPLPADFDARLGEIGYQ